MAEVVWPKSIVRIEELEAFYRPGITAREEGYDNDGCKVS